MYINYYDVEVEVDWRGHRCGWRGKWEEMMMKEPCDYYSHIIIEDAEADERIQPMDTEAEVMVMNRWEMEVEEGAKMKHGVV